MLPARRLQLGLGFLALSLGLATSGLAPGAAAVRIAQQPSAAPSVALPAVQPTPYPLVTLGPLGQGTPIPYPAYGTPVPGVGAGTPAPGIPQRLSLQQAVAIGFARSPILASARADVAVAAAGVRLNQAGLLPSFSGSASTAYNHQQAGSFSVPSGGATSAPSTSSSRTFADFWSNSLSLSLRQLIYDGGRVAASVRAARRSESAFVDTYRRQLQTVAFNVATAYYNYLASIRTVQVDLEIVRQDQVQEDLVRAQVRAGTAARVDILTAQLPTAQARLAVVRAQGQELANQAAFANAMGLDADVDVQPIDDAPIFTMNQVSSIPIPTYTSALQRAIALRPDYDSAVQQVESAKETLREAKLGLFPSLSASGSYGDSSTNQGGGALRNSGTIGLALSVPIYDQGLTAANSAQAQGQLDKAAANLQNTKLGVQLSLKQALTNLVSARAALDQTEVEYSQAVQVLQSTQAQYRAGVTTLPLLLNAQVGLTQALTDQVNAVYSLREAEQAYLYAVGANYETPQS